MWSVAPAYIHTLYCTYAYTFFFSFTYVSAWRSRLHTVGKRGKVETFNQIIDVAASGSCDDGLNAKQT